MTTLHHIATTLICSTGVFVCSYLYYQYVIFKNTHQDSNTNEDYSNTHSRTPSKLKYIWQQGTLFPFLYNYPIQNTLLKSILEENTAVENWKLLVSLGKHTRMHMHETVFEQHISRCAYHHTTSHLLFPILWDNMEVHKLLIHMKYFFKSATPYGVRVSTSKDAIKKDFTIDNRNFQGKLLATVIPGSSDFQIIMMSYTKHYTLQIEGVLTRAGVTYQKKNIQRWKDADGEDRRLDKKCINITHLESQPYEIRLVDNTLIVQTSHYETHFQFTINTQQDSKQKIHFSNDLPLINCIGNELHQL